MNKFLLKYLLTLLLVEFSMATGYLWGMYWFIGFLLFSIMYTCILLVIKSFRNNNG